MQEYEDTISSAERFFEGLTTLLKVYEGLLRVSFDSVDVQQEDIVKI